MKTVLTSVLRQLGWWHLYQTSGGIQENSMNEFVVSQFKDEDEFSDFLMTYPEWVTKVYKEKLRLYQGAEFILKLVDVDEDNIKRLVTEEILNHKDSSYLCA
tara:strand:+ start:31 stop:336 length:306 start_codon:yes stop_codon:yes gene_type:complete